MVHRGFIILVISSFLIQCSLCDSILQISDQKELKKFLRTHTNVLILYKETSRSARDWQPVLQEAAASIEGKGSIVQIDCSNEKKLCKRMKANPSPVILKHYKDGKFHKDYDRLKSSRSVVRFLEDPTSDMPWDEDKTANAIVHIDSPKGFSRLVTREQKPILVMFYAPWCGYCKRMKPEFASAAKELKQEAVLVGMDVDKPEMEGIRTQFNITGFPTLMYILQGRILYRYAGNHKKESLVSWMRNPQPPKEPEEEKKWSDEDNAVDIRFPTTDTFDTLLKENPSVLVMFYAPWCGHCKAMKPAFAEAATKLRSSGISGILAAIDATKEADIAQRFKVQGYPTVKYFKDGEFAFDFNERTADGLVEFMKDPKEPPPPPPPEVPWSEQPSDVHHLTAENYHSFLRKKKHVLVMLYAPWCGHCKQAKPEFMKAAETMKDDRKVSFAALDCTEYSDLCTAEGVKGFPTFNYYNFGKKDPKGYTMERDAEDFIAFMSNPSDPKPAGQTKHWKAVEGYKDLHFLDATNFDSVLQDSDALFVKFYAPWCGHCKAMKPAFAQLAVWAKETIPNIKIGTIDATADEKFATKFGISGYPTILYFKRDGTQEKYRGARTVEDMKAYIQEKQTKSESKDKSDHAGEKPPTPKARNKADTFSDNEAAKPSEKIIDKTNDALKNKDKTDHAKKPKPDVPKTKEKTKEPSKRGEGKQEKEVKKKSEDKVVKKGSEKTPTVKKHSSGKKREEL